MSAKTVKNWRDHQLTVAVRVRPFTENELEFAPSKIAHVVDENMVVLLDPTEDPDDILRANRSREKQYVFDFAFDGKATQEEVYEKSTKFLIDGVLDGFNATVFAYGATGAGKTYTMLGQDEDPGIMARTLNDLFQAMESTKEDLIYKVTMSYLEIYNEMIRDLLNPSAGFLDLREDATGNVQVAGISEVSTKSTREVMRLLTRGNKERTSEPTAANKTSSRSHAILQVTVKRRSRVRDTSQEIRVGKLFMIDLAGSERAAQTKNRGKRMIEGAHINRSLLALGNCINALAERGGLTKYVNFRDSKLTRLLKDSLGGNCRTVMIAHISPASLFFEESRNTLLYADRAKNIKTRVKANFMNVSYHIAQYTSIIADLRKEISRLKQKISEQEVQQRPASIKVIQSEVERTAALQDKKELDKLRQVLVKTFQEQMEIRRSLMELENTNMEIAMDTSKHLLTIAEWEQEQARRALKKKNEKDSDDSLDNRDKENNQEKEMESEESSSLQPTEVIIAKEEISSLQAEQKKISKLKAELEKKLDVVKEDAVKLEQNLPQKISSEEQKEMLSLLCKVHELEVENAEMQSSALIRDNMLRQRDLVIERYEHYRGLRDEIIHQQKVLMDDNDVQRTSELEDLYEQYQLMMVEEGNLSRYTSTTLEPAKDFSLPMINAQFHLESEDTSDEKDDPLPPTKKLLPKRSNERNSQEDNNQTRLFKQSPRSRQLREKEQRSTVLPKQSKSVPSDTFITQLTPSSGSTTPTELHLSHSSDEGGKKSSNPSLSDKKEINKKTKNIAAIAAKRKTRQALYSKPKFDRLNLQDKSVVSLNSVHEVSESDVESEYLSRSRLAKHDRLLGNLTPPPAQALSEDSFSIDAGDRRGGGLSDSTSVNTRNRYGYGGAKKNNSKQVTDKRHRRSNNRPYDQSNFLKKHGGHNRRAAGRKVAAPTSRQPLFSGDSDVLTFEVSQTPPMTVYQAGAERGKGHTVQKKYRGVTNAPLSDSSASSTPQGSQRNARKHPSIPAHTQKATLSVSGFTVPRNERINRRI